jgi:peptidoglycan/xylan/chitin deacetylase (PgdA/CDA1 family)
VTGSFVNKYPEAVKKIHEAGHEIGNHTDTYPHVNNLSLDKNMKEIANCNNRIRSVTGMDTKLYRGAYGEYNDTVMQAVENSKHQAIGWSIDSMDYMALAGDEMWKNIKPKLAKGAILLLNSGTENMALSLDMILRNIKQEGYNVITVSELMKSVNKEVV